jgi:hypothetical protein
MYYCAEEAAEYLGVSVSELRNIQMSKYKKNSRLFYSETVLEICRKKLSIQKAKQAKQAKQKKQKPNENIN